jgi:hypothetical protein
MGRRVTLTCFVALAGAALAPAVAQGATVALQDDRLPVVPMEELEQRLDLFKSTGAKVARVDLFWSDIAPTRPRKAADPADPAYDWTRADAIFKGLKKRKITPLVSVYSTPQWAAIGKKVDPLMRWNPFAPVPAHYAVFMGTLAKRYSGKYVIFNEGPLPQVRHFEIWNEPNLQLYFRPQRVGGKYVSIKNYTAMVKAAYPKIKKANKRAVVIAGVAGPKGKSNASGLGSLPWLAGIAKTKVKFDSYSQHIYPAAAPKSKTKAKPSWNTVPVILKELDKIKKGMHLYITEAGYTTQKTPYRNVRVTVKQQALFMKQLYALPVVRSPRIPAVVWFNLQDNPFWPGGLLRLDSTNKPSLKVFRSLAIKSKLTPAFR